MLLDCAIHASLIKKRFSHTINQSTICVFTGFFVTQDTIAALVLQLVWYCSTSWVSNICDLVLVLIFWFRIIKCGWFFMLGIIASNFLIIWNGWAIVVKYATTVVYIETHFFPQFLENSRSQNNACNNVISSKNTHWLNGKGIYDCTENMSGITVRYQNYAKSEWSEVRV